MPGRLIRLAMRLLMGLLTLALLAGGLGLYARHRYLAPGPLPAARAIVVAHGSVAELATALRADGAIASTLEFRLAEAATRAAGPLHAAELAFPAHASLALVLHILRTAPPVRHFLTIPEGLTAQEIAALLRAAPAMVGAVPDLPEGAVLPQTYEYVWGTPRVALLARAQAAMRATLAKVWAGRAPDPALASPRDLLILASIVERETALADERPIIAAVFLNRLRLGMRLQSDPTVVYAASHGLGRLDHPISRADLAIDSPYNTYRIAGLPPGPICAPGLASLEAVAHPAASADLYFVANGKGGHAFARTLAQHDRNVAKWRALSQAQPGAATSTAHHP